MQDIYQARGLAGALGVSMKIFCRHPAKVLLPLSEARYPVRPHDTDSATRLEQPWENRRTFYRELYWA